MSKTCPYQLKTTRQQIHCTGPEEGTAIYLGFSSLTNHREYQAQYCQGNYHHCLIAGMLDPALRPDHADRCLYNEAVACHRQSRCSHCGWYPAETCVL